MSNTIEIPTNPAAIKDIIDKSNAAINAALNRTDGEILAEGRNDYFTPVRNMGYHLKQVVKDNVVYGIATLITRRMLQLVAQNLPKFAGKVYNVRVNRMVDDCLNTAISQIVGENIKVRAYINRSGYGWQRVVCYMAAVSAVDTVEISFDFDANKLTQGEKRIVKGEDMDDFIKDLYREIARLNTKIQAIEESNYLLCDSNYICAYLLQAIEVEEQANKLKQDFKRLTGEQYYRFDYGRTSVSTLPAYRD